MKWKIFSRKRRKEAWRLIFKPAGDMADVMALPGAVVEGQIAGRYLLSSGVTAGTVIVQGVSRKGILAGVDVAVDHEAASEHDVDVAYQPRSGRASLRPSETINFEEMMRREGNRIDVVGQGTVKIVDDFALFIAPREAQNVAPARFGVK